MRALELDSTCLVAMVQRGKCYMAKKNWEQAVSWGVTLSVCKVRLKKRVLSIYLISIFIHNPYHPLHLSIHFLQVRDLERVNNRDRHNQQNKKKAGDAALRQNKHDEAFRMYQASLAAIRKTGTPNGA